MLRLTRLLTLRSLRARPLRSGLSLLGIALGVAGLLAIGATNQTALRAVTRLMQDTSGRANLVVAAAEADGAGLSDTVVPRLANMRGVAAAVPSLRVQTVLAGEAQPAEIGLSLFGADVGGLTLYGIEPAGDARARTYSLTAGRFLAPDGGADLVLVESFAHDHDLQLGQRVALATPNGVEKFRLVGLIAKDGPGQINNGAFGVIALEPAQKIFNQDGRVSQVDVVAVPEGQSAEALEALKQALQSRLGGEYSVTYPAAQGRRMTQMLSNYQIGLNLMSSMALFVGAFLIYNAFSMTVVERTREIGFLRTIGLTRWQVIQQVLVEAGLLGVLGTALGVGLGLLLARGLTAFMALLLAQPLGAPELPAETLGVSVALGLCVTVLAALVPAWQAGRIAPLEALRVRGNQREGWLLRHAGPVGVGVLALSAGLLVANPFPYDVQFRLGSLTVFGLFFGGTLLIPASVAVWERLARPVVQRLYGGSGRLGSRNLRRSKWRTTLTVAALMVGTALILVTRGMTDAFKYDLENWIQAYIGGDLYVFSAVPLRPEVGRRLTSTAGVAAAAPVRYLEVKWLRPDGGAERVTLMATDPAAYTQVTRFVFSDSAQDPSAAAARLAAGNAVFVSSVLAEKYGLAIGQTLRLSTASGPRAFIIAAIVVDFYNQGLVLHGSWTDLQRYFKERTANAYLVKVAPGYAPAEVAQRLDQLYGPRDRLTIETNQAIIQRVFTLLAQANSLFDVLALIAMLVAALGVVNTLTMSVIERTAEIGMLRSLGMRRRQVVGMVLAEAGLMGLIGGVLGLAFGLVLTRVFLLAMTAMSGYQLTYRTPWAGLAAGLFIAWLATQVAAALPARRAARIQVLEAIHYE